MFKSVHYRRKSYISKAVLQCAVKDTHLKNNTRWNSKPDIQISTCNSGGYQKGVATGLRLEAIRLEALALGNAICVTSVINSTVYNALHLE